MQKLLMVFLVFLIVGCTKQYITQPVKTGEAGDTKTEEISKDRAAADAAREKLLSGDKLKTVVLPTAKDEARFEFKDALFDYDSYKIRQDARAVLDSAAEWLKKNKNIKVVIEGNCDERGTNEYNLALGESRAKSVRDYLASLGVAPARMTFVTYGEEKPLCAEQNESCWQKNRRAHLVAAR